MSVGVPMADAIAIAEARGWHPEPPAARVLTPMPAPAKSGRVRRGVEWSDTDVRARRWAEFLVEAAFRAAAAAALRRPPYGSYRSSLKFDPLPP